MGKGEVEGEVDNKRGLGDNAKNQTRTGCSVGPPEEVLKTMMTEDGGIEDRGEVAGRSKNSHSTQLIHPFVIITIPLSSDLVTSGHTSCVQFRLEL